MKKNRLCPKEIRMLKELLEKVPAVPNIPQEIFTPLMSKNVPVTLELAIVKGGRILLILRDDPFFKGWHFPGSFLIPGETFEHACRRVAFKEANVKIRKTKFITIRNVLDDKRFHCVSLFFFCPISRDLTKGRWFLRCPSDIIPEHKKLWSFIKSYLRKTF